MPNNRVWICMSEYKQVGTSHPHPQHPAPVWEEADGNSRSRDSWTGREPQCDQKERVDCQPETGS